jgi:uncharacterized RDD family membrane protein YckC
MAKISELTDRQLSTNLKKYAELCESEPENERNTKIYAQIKKEITKRKTHDAGDVSAKPVKEKKVARAASKKKVEKFHNDNEDYSSYGEASFKSRALAFALDGVFYNIINQIIMALMGVLIKIGGSTMVMIGTGLGILLTFIVLPYVYYIMPMMKNGQTVGKKIMKIKVIHREGSHPLSAWDCVKRDIIGKIISGMVFMLGYIVVLFKKNAWHDEIAKTKVIAID